MDKITVAKYLQIRLEQLGLTHLFGIAGNYSAPFLNTINESPDSKIRIVGDTNEINAGHCVDAYARITGFGAVAVTYGVGAFSLLNPVAGSFVEHCPVLVINGAPTSSDQMKNLGEGFLASHMTGDMYSNINVYRHVTVAAELVMSSTDAPYKIDSVLNACMIYGRPVYLEVFEDVWRMECTAPGPLIDIKRSGGCEEMAKKAVSETVKLIVKYKNPIFWAGVEIQRHKLQHVFLDLLERSKIEFTTAILGKGVVSEKHPQFMGVFNGNASPIDVKDKFEKAGVKIGLGAWTTGKNLGGFDIWSEQTVLVNHSSVRVGAKFYPNVSLGAFMELLADSLEKELEAGNYAPYDMIKQKVTRNSFVAKAKRPAEKTPITFDSFFTAINDFINEKHVVVSDAGFSLLGAQGLHIAEADGFIAQASWLSIGYSVPAATGVKCAMPNKRAVVFIGDGAFQETCQAISTQNRLGHDTIVFVLDNTIYGIEQLLANPNPFRKGKDKIDYPLKDMNEVYQYNDMHPWNYAKLTEVFGGKGFEVTHMHELHNVISKLDKIKKNVLVHVHLPKTDIPEAISYKNNKPGEDEFLAKGWTLC